MLNESTSRFEGNKRSGNGNLNELNGPHERGREQVEREMTERSSVGHADVLHVTSWNADHCNKYELPDLPVITQVPSGKLGETDNIGKARWTV